MIFLRHPVPRAEPGLCYGRMDLDIAPEGHAQIAAAAAETPVPAIVVSSPALRCRALAGALARGAPVRHDQRLLELDFGAWEGRRWWDIPRGESDPWADDPWAVAPPGGETFAALHARTKAALADAPDGAVIVTHAGVIRAARMILTGATFDTVFAAKVPYAEPIRLTPVTA